MKLSLGFSPCPNDTFMFDGLVNSKINHSPFTFDVSIKDVEELNNRAFQNEFDITKVSFHAYAYISSDYQILNSGSALGHNNGPLLISKRKIYPDEVNDLNIAIPGKYTTANLLLSVAFPFIQHKKEYLFSDIEEVVLSDEADAGLIIHENRFTFQNKGLKKIIDLGEWWEKQTESPIPLGCIIIKRNIPSQIKKEISRLIHDSIQYAFSYPDNSRSYIKEYAASMDENVIKQHIDLYVNDYSVNLGEKGKEAILKLYEKAGINGNFPSVPADIFID